MGGDRWCMGVTGGDGRGGGGRGLMEEGLGFITTLSHTRGTKRTGGTR